MRWTVWIIVLMVMAGGQVGAATLVVANKAEATASLLDLPGGQVRATVPVGEGPHEVAVSPDGRLAVVADYGRKTAGNTLTVIDVVTAEVVRTIELGRYARPHGLVFISPEQLVVTAEDARALVLVDVAAGRVLQAVDTGAAVSHMVAVAPGLGRAYVANIGSGSVSVIDLAAGSLVAEVATGEGAEGVAVTPAGHQVWVTNRGADTVTVLDGKSLKVLAELDNPSFPIRAEVTPDGARVLVSNARSGDLSVFSTEPPRLVSRINLPAPEATSEGRLFGDRFGSSSVPIGIEIAPDGTTAWVAHANADAISVVDLEAMVVQGHLKAGREPDGMGWSPLSAGGSAP